MKEKSDKEIDIMINELKEKYPGIWLMTPKQGRVFLDVIRKQTKS